MALFIALPPMLYSIGGKAINEDGFVPYKYNQY